MWDNHQAVSMSLVGFEHWRGNNNTTNLPTNKAKNKNVFKVQVAPSPIWEFIAIKKDMRENHQATSMSLVRFEHWRGITTPPIYQPTKLLLTNKRTRMFEEWVWEKGHGVVDSNSKPNILKKIMISGRQRIKGQRMLWAKLKLTALKKRLSMKSTPRWRKNIETWKN